MDADEIAYLRELVATHRKRLRNLELKAAGFGINCPPEIEIEITEIKKKIENLEQKLGPVAKSQPTPQPIAPEKAKFSLFQSIFSSRIGILLVVILAFLALSARSFFAYVMAYVNPAAATATTATSNSSPIAGTTGTGQTHTIILWNKSTAIITTRDGNQFEIIAGSLLYGLYPRVTLESGISIPFEKMSDFEVNEVTERGADISITLLNGGIMSGRTNNADFTATIVKDNLSLSLPAENVSKVEFQR